MTEKHLLKTEKRWLTKDTDEEETVVLWPPRIQAANLDKEKNGEWGLKSNILDLADYEEFFTPEFEEAKERPVLVSVQLTASVIESEET